MTEKLDQININKKESDNNREKFILCRSTTIAELVQQGMLTKEQQDVLELGDEITLWEYIAYEPAEGKMTEDTDNTFKNFLFPTFKTLFPSIDRIK